jgi:antirestriction protein
MTVTLTANYQEVLNAVTVEKIEELLEENYALDDMLVFIDEYNENDFVAYYEEYVRVGEAIGYEAVDALIGEMGCVSDIEDCDERYQGCFDDEADFAEQFMSDMGYDIPVAIVVDWEATWEQNLRYDFTACNDGTSYRPATSSAIIESNGGAIPHAAVSLTHSFLNDNRTKD